MEKQQKIQYLCDWSPAAEEDSGDGRKVKEIMPQNSLNLAKDTNFGFKKLSKNQK